MYMTVHDVVMDWSYVLAGFLVSTLFGVSPGHFSHCKCFFTCSHAFLDEIIEWRVCWSYKLVDGIMADTELVLLTKS